MGIDDDKEGGDNYWRPAARSAAASRMPDQTPLHVVKEFLRGLERTAPSTLTLQRSLSEAWFSNTLTWLLDRRGSHGLRVAFAEAFTERVGSLRSQGDAGRPYERRPTFLKVGRGGPGVGASGFGFGNASVLREFYLSPSVGPDGHDAHYCDVVFLDLDTDDSFFLTIENKLFMAASAPQLVAYQETVDRKYHRARVREFVCLTLRQTDAITRDSDGRAARQWVHLSWTGDVLDILDRLSTKAPRGGKTELFSLRRLLRWLDAASSPEALPEKTRLAFRDQLVRAAGDCLLEELRRLHAEGGGEWLLTRDNEASGRSLCIRHSTHSRSIIRVALLPGLSVAIEEWPGSRRPRFDKIIVPFGAHPAQIFNLLDIAARDVYRGHFETSARRGDARWRPVNRGEVKERYTQLFEFVYRQQQALKVVLYRTFLTPAP